MKNFTIKSYDKFNFIIDLNVIIKLLPDTCDRLRHYSLFITDDVSTLSLQLESGSTYIIRFESLCNE